jgi:lipopolysaccharide transport system ATP-binding protein
LSHREQPVGGDAGARIVAKFHFQMPVLPRGDYSINVAVANGTQQDHVQQHWIHDALMFRSESSSVSTGLVGIPMDEIELGIEAVEPTSDVGVNP